jgi:integrase
MLANPTEAALSTELAEAVDRARDFAKASKAHATRKAYASDLRDFAAYCQRIGALSLPADPGVVGTYLAPISETKSVATIRRRMVAIAQAHKDAGAPNPVAHSDVQKVLAGIVRTKTVARKDALTKDRLEEAVKALGSDLKGQRDRALLLLTFACAMRRAEAATLDVADLRYDARGLVVTLRRSKTHQEGQGREIAVPFVANGRLCAATHVRKWLDAADTTEGPVFRTFNGGKKLTANRIAPIDVARLVKRLTLAAGIEGDFAAHSLRAGFITSAAATKGVFGGRHSTCFRASLGRDLARLRAAGERLRRSSADRDPWTLSRLA